MNSDQISVFLLIDRLLMLLRRIDNLQMTKAQEGSEMSSKLAKALITTASISTSRPQPFPGLPEGVLLWQEYLSRAEQEAMVADVRTAITQAPLFRGTMPKTGKPLGLQMSNLGDLGWFADRSGYRYVPNHPKTGAPWPAILPSLMELWDSLGDYPAPPEACLVNYYGPENKLSLHQDMDELDVHAPILSVSLGDQALYRLGGLARKDKTQSFRLNSGDVLVLTGPARMRFHGVDRIYPGTSTLLKQPGRINLTLRRVNFPPDEPQD